MGPRFDPAFNDDVARLGHARLLPSRKWIEDARQISYARLMSYDERSPMVAHRLAGDKAGFS